MREQRIATDVLDRPHERYPTDDKRRHRDAAQPSVRRSFHGATTSRLST
jgi:hypothetical protein